MSDMHLDSLQQLKIAFQADGSYSSRGNKYNGKNTGCISIRFSLKKQRKKNRLRDILDSLPFEYSWKEYENGYCSVRVKLPVNIFKTFSKELDNMFTVGSNAWCKSFIYELGYWDGTYKSERPNNISYSSVLESNVLFVKQIAQGANFSATYNCYKDKRTDYIRKPIYSTNINLKASI